MSTPNLILTWYGLERLLFRLSISPFSDRFVLKGGMLFRLWSGPDFRATRDLDLLGFVRRDAGVIETPFAPSAISLFPRMTASSST